MSAEDSDPMVGAMALALQVQRLAYEARGKGSGFHITLSPQEALQLTGALLYYRQRTRVQGYPGTLVVRDGSPEGLRVFERAHPSAPPVVFDEPCGIDPDPAEL